MTTVYGVTRLGATQQIMNRLVEMHEVDDFNGPVERKDLPNMAKFVAGLTLTSLGENFKGATDSMAWLLAVARLISTECHQPVQWTTPLGFPIMQPYFDIKSRRVQTVLHDMVVMKNRDLDFEADNTNAPVKLYKQVQALPPNFVHSLDSSHMLMTAAACREVGLTFAAVHDSYWTHACDMEKMNTILRDQFVALHQSTDLPRLYEQLQQTYSCKLGHGTSCEGYDDGKKGPCKHAENCMRVRWDKLDGPPPAQGELDIAVVRDSVYFFS
jgi:DNA-directed RNA polymerase